LANIAEKESNLKSKNNPFTADFIRTLFDEHRDNTESKALQGALENTKFSIQGETITVYTPTQIYIDFVRQEQELIERIHSEFPEIDVKLKFEVNEETFPEYKAPKKPKHLTTKEKYEMLIRKNESFKQLVNELKLKIAN